MSADIPDDPLVYPRRFSFNLANLPLSRMITFDQFIVCPYGYAGELRPREHKAGRVFELSARGVYVVREPRAQPASHIRDGFHRYVENLHFLLTFANGGFVPILDTQLAASYRDGAWDQPALRTELIVPRGRWTIYSTDDQLEAFVRDAWPVLLDPEIAYGTGLRGALYYLSIAFDQEPVEAQFLLSWIALESFVHASGMEDTIVTGNKFRKRVRPVVESAIQNAANSDQAIAEGQAAMCAKIPELNRHPIDHLIRDFLLSHGQDVDQQTLDDLKRTRNNITHVGAAQNVIPEISVRGDIPLDAGEPYWQGIHTLTWKLINLLRAAVIDMLVSEPLRGELLEGMAL